MLAAGPYSPYYDLCHACKYTERLQSADFNALSFPTIFRVWSRSKGHYTRGQ